jgi:2-polyprenyl-3-methyl-5-hydroxy-6-metoxy-1,4-benzoquinol methylase
VKPHLRGRVLDYGCGVGYVSDLKRPDEYHGVDIDEESVEIARKRRPGHKFESLHEFRAAGPYDTVACLAVIEHVTNPAQLLREFRNLLAADGRIVLTTPHPSMEWAHGLGAKIGLFSQEGHEEHQSLLEKRDFGELARETGLKLALYRRFLLGANQLVIYEVAP